MLVNEGRRYGLELNWSKTSMINIHSDASLTQPNGEAVPRVERDRADAGHAAGGSAAESAAL